MMNKKIYKRALTLAVPMMIQNGITNMVSLVDNVMVGSLGTEAMTGVSIVGQLFFVLSLAVFGGLSGPGIYGAQYYGKGDMEGVRNTFRLKLWIGAFCAILGGIVLSALAAPLIQLYLRGESAGMDSAGTLEFGMQYLQIMLLTIIPFAITQVYASSLRETGDSFKPMVAGVISVVVDIVMNYILIYGKLGMPALGVRGAAIATVMARITELLVVVIWAHKRSDKHVFLQGVYKTLKVPVNAAGKIIRKGLPIFFNELLWAAGIAVLTQCYSIRGLEVVAGLNISNAICNLLNVVFVSLGSAVGILSGQTLGAGKFEEAKRNARHLMVFSGVLCVFLTLILVSVSGIFPKLYDTTDVVRNYGKWFIVITAVFFPVQGVLNALYFTLRSGGKTVITFFFDSVYSWVVSVSLAASLCYFTNLPILVVYAIVQAADLLKIGVGLVMIQKGIWVSRIIDEE